EADQRVTGDLVGETRATVAQDAALPVEQHQIADRDRLFEVPLLLDVPALTGAMAEGLVLQRALAALVADRAVERMVRQQQVDDALLGLPRGLALRVDDHAGCDRDHARRLQCRATPGVDVDEAHAAHADRCHALVVAEARDVVADPLCRGDHELALARDHRSTVDRQVDGVGIRRRRHCIGSWISGRHGAPPTETGIRLRCTSLASNSSRNSVRAEWTGAYADGPTKQIVVILYGNGTASRPRRSLAAWGKAPGQIVSPTSINWSRSRWLP